MGEALDISECHTEYSLILDSPKPLITTDLKDSKYNAQYCDNESSSLYLNRLQPEIRLSVISKNKDSESEL